MTIPAQCPRHPAGHDGRLVLCHVTPFAQKTATAVLSRKTGRRRAGFLLVLLLAFAVTGCASMTALWRQQHYAITLCLVADGRFAQERLFSVTPPDGVPVKCKISPIFTTNDIVAAEKVMKDKTVVALRLTLAPESHMRWLQVREEVRDGAIAVIVDDYACLVVAPVTAATFSDTDTIRLTGTFDPALLEQVVKHAESNYTLKKMKEWR